MPDARHSQKRYCGPRVLLVEDEPRARGAIAEALDEAGLPVAGAASAEAALHAAAAEPAGPPPAVLVTDIELAPGMAWTRSGWPRKRGGAGPALAWSTSPAAGPGSTGRCSARATAFCPGQSCGWRWCGRCAGW